MHVLKRCSIIEIPARLVSALSALGPIRVPWPAARITAAQLELVGVSG